jgi:RNA polymerase sigma factor for flagellar operon FliA
MKERNRIKKKYKEFDKLPEEELWRRYKKSKDIDIRNYFIEKYSPLVKYVVGRISANIIEKVDVEDLISYGIFGLIEAIERFDPEKGVKFKTYAITRIRGQIFDELRAIDWIPRNVRQKAKELERLIYELEVRFGRSVKDEEIAKELGVSMEEYYKLLNSLSGTAMVSLNDIYHSNDDKGLEFMLSATLKGSDDLNPDVMLEKEEIKNFIAEAIKTLPEKEKMVIILYYYEELTLKEIGEVLGVTESRVSQLHTKAILTLRSKIAKMKEKLGF